MSTTLTYALILSACQIIFSLLMYFLGFQTEKIAMGQHLQWLSLGITIVVLWLGLKAVREEAPDKSLPYGRGVGAGALIALFSSIIGSIYAFIHFKFINVNFADYQLELMRTKWAEKGLSEAQMENAEAMTRKFMTPVVFSVSSLVVGFVISFVIVLIIAAILRREPAKAVPAA